MCIFCQNGNSLKTAHSKMAFWDSKKKNTGLNKTLMCEQLQQQQKKNIKGFFNNHDSIFVILSEMEELKNFRNSNK